MGDSDLDRMIEEMRPYLSTDVTQQDFSQPSLLQDVPAFTSDNSSGELNFISHAKLRRNS